MGSARSSALFWCRRRLQFRALTAGRRSRGQRLRGLPAGFASLGQAGPPIAPARLFRRVHPRSSRSDVPELSPTCPFAYGFFLRLHGVVRLRGAIGLGASLVSGEVRSSAGTTVGTGDAGCCLCRAHDARHRSVARTASRRGGSPHSAGGCHPGGESIPARLANSAGIETHRLLRCRQAWRTDSGADHAGESRHPQ